MQDFGRMRDHARQQAVSNWDVSAVTKLIKASAYGS